MNSQKGKESIVLRGHGPRSLLHLYGSMDTFEFVLADTPFQIRNIFPLASARALLAQAVVLSRDGKPHLHRFLISGMSDERISRQLTDFSGHG
jgi:hypothetical protein